MYSRLRTSSSSLRGFLMVADRHARVNRRSLGDELHQMQQGLCGLLQPAARVELQLAVELVAAGEDVGARESAERQLGPVRAAADRLREGREPGASRRLQCVLGDLGV